MNDEQFMAWVEGWCAAVQDCDFGPTVPYFKNEDGSINRDKTLDGTAFTNLSDACRQKLARGAE